ncbi:MAG: tetratricopeptide repeat protein [Bacteroidota bacterium]
MKYSEVAKIQHKAKKHINKKEYQLAVDCLQPIIEFDKLKFPYSFMLLLLAEVKGDYQELLRECNELIETEVEKYFYYAAKGNAYYDLKEYQDALKFYDKVIELDDRHAFAYNTKGNILYALKEYDNALDCFDKSIKIDGEYVFAYNGKGATYSYFKKYEKALNCFNKAIELDSEYMSLYVGIGNVYDNLGEYEKAIEFYNKATQLDSENVLTYKNKANTFYRLKNYNEAIQNYQKAIQLNPELEEGLKYQIERAKTELEEQRKNQNDTERKEISDLINDIKTILEYKGKQVCHYTKTNVLTALCDGSKLRFSHVGLVNDPTEGKSLYDFLRVNPIERKDQSGFIGSFVESKNDNFLPLWRAYGSDGEGVSICLDTDILINKTATIGEDKDSKITGDLTTEKRKLYRVAYIDEKGTIFLDGEKNTPLKERLNEIKEILDELLKDNKTPDEVTLEPLVEIQYLFKNAIYKVEKEVRYYDLWKNEASIVKWDFNLSPPTTFIEVDNDIRNSIHKITIGPKAKDATKWMALYKTRLAREGNTKVEITQSKIPYR